MVSFILCLRSNWCEKIEISESFSNTKKKGKINIRKPYISKNFTVQKFLHHNSQVLINFNVI